MIFDKLSTKVFLITDIAPRFIAMLSETFWLYRNGIRLRSTVYHLQTNFHIKCYNRSAVAQRCHYITDHRVNCDERAKSSTCVYSTYVSWLDKTICHSCFLSREPPSLSNAVSRTGFYSDAHPDVPPYVLRLPVLAHMEDLIKHEWKPTWTTKRQPQERLSKKFPDIADTQGRPARLRE